MLTNNLNVFSINPSNGALTLVQTVDTTATSTASNSVGHGPVTVLLNPAGTFAYVVSAIDNSVTAYSINASTGMLTAVANGSAATGKIPRGMAIVAVP